MKQSNLVVGDLIFYVSPSLDIVEHTAIYLGEKEGVPYVLHAARDSYKTMMVTHFKNTVDAEFRYRVMRPRDIELSINAIIIFLGWVEYQVPYASQEKIERLLFDVEKYCSLEQKESAKIQADYGKKNYCLNYNQYLVMANALPYIVIDNDDIEGFGCAESVVTAFNLALLMRHARQERSSEGRISWSIGDITMDEFVGCLHNPLPFDAKRSLSAGLYEHCANSPDDWVKMGELTPQASVAPDEDAKELWKSFKEILKARALLLIEKRRTSPDYPSMKLRYTPSGTQLNLIDIIDYASTEVKFNAFTSITPQSYSGLTCDVSNEPYQRQRAVSLGSPISTFFRSPSRSVSEMSSTKSFFS